MGKKAVLIINNATGNVTISAAGVPNTYSITSKITNGTLSGATTIQYDSGATVTVLPNTGYNLPSSVSVSGATVSSYASSTGKLVLTNCTGNVTVTGTCVVKTFTITTTVKNGTSSGSTSITYGGSGSITITPGSDYKLPSSITVSGATYTYSSTTGIINLSSATGNVVITVVCEEKPKCVKGDLIQMELGNGTPSYGTNNQYRVLNISGNIAEVVAMYDMGTMVFGSSQTYLNSTLDNYLNSTFYNSLNATARNAIIAKDITQKKYSYSDSEPSSYTYSYQYNWLSDIDYLTLTNTTTVGSRYVYALDVADIFDYQGSNYISSNELMTLFFKTTGSVSRITWLRSSSADNSSYVFNVPGSYGTLLRNGFSNSYAARPAFKIDLSKISYTVVN